jgi:hypothetical protein
VSEPVSPYGPDPLVRWLERHRHWPYVAMEWEGSLILNRWDERDEPYSVCWHYRDLLIERQRRRTTWHVHVVAPGVGVEPPTIPVAQPPEGMARVHLDAEWRPTATMIMDAGSRTALVKVPVVSDDDRPAFDWRWHHNLWVAQIDVQQVRADGRAQLFPGVGLSRATVEKMVDALPEGLYAIRRSERLARDIAAIANEEPPEIQWLPLKRK